MNKNNLSQKGFIVPVIVSIIAFLIIIGGLYIYSNKNVEAPIVNEENPVVQNINIKSFKLGTLEFSYPSNLSYGSSGEGPLISLSHFVPFKHVNSCDLKDGLSINNAIDFSSSFKLNNTNIVNSIKNDNPYGYTDMIKNGALLIQPGFIDKYKIGSLDGYKISIGVEGCGYSTYYFPISANETLVVRRDVYLQTLQMGREELINIPGFISQIQEEQIFNDILSSVKGLSNQKTMSIKLYFANNILNPEMLDCGLMYPVYRVIPETKGVASATLSELLKGPTEEEKKNGYFSSIPVGTKVNSIKMVGDTLYIDFNEMVMGGGGSCGQMAKYNSFMTTLKQFPSIKDVKMTVDGKGNTEDIFQP